MTYGLATIHEFRVSVVINVSYFNEALLLRRWLWRIYERHVTWFGPIECRYFIFR